VNDFAGLNDCPDDVPPWERPGAVRRDCASHRGEILGPCGKIALILGLGAICCAPVTLISLPLGLVVWWVACADLARMANGRMDPAGRRQTGRAAADGQFAFWFSLTWLALHLLMLGWLLSQLMRW